MMQLLFVLFTFSGTLSPQDLVLNTPRPTRTRRLDAQDTVLNTPRPTRTPRAGL